MNDLHNAPLATIDPLIADAIDNEVARGPSTSAWATRGSRSFQTTPSSMK